MVTGQLARIVMKHVQNTSGIDRYLIILNCTTAFIKIINYERNLLLAVFYRLSIACLRACSSQTAQLVTAVEADYEEKYFWKEGV